MSTKIYDAYRILKEECGLLTHFLSDIKDDIYNQVLSDKEMLMKVHLLTYKWLIDNDSSDNKLEKYREGDTYFHIRDFLQESEESPVQTIGLFSVKVNCSIFEDERFWYFKFFINNNWQREKLNSILGQHSGFMDYHYQNQADPPDGITWGKYSHRGDVWDHIMMGRHDYMNGLQYTFFDADDFHKMMYIDQSRLAYDLTQNLNDTNKTIDDVL